MTSNKFTLVANPFPLPIEEVGLIGSDINKPSGFVGIMGPEGRFFEPGCTDSDEKGLHYVSIGLYEYDIEDYDLTESPHGWLIYDQSRTKIREHLFQIFKKIKNKSPGAKFNRPRFSDYSSTIRIGSVASTNIIIEPATYNINSDRYERIGHTFDGGGACDNMLTVLPIPEEYDVMDVLGMLSRHPLTSSIRCIISKHNYYYKVRDSHVWPTDGPHIPFLNSKYCYLILEGWQKENPDINVFINFITNNMKCPYYSEFLTTKYLNVYTVRVHKKDSCWLIVPEVLMPKIDAGYETDDD